MAKPTVGYVLSLIGSISYVIAGLIIATSPLAADSTLSSIAGAAAVKTIVAIWGFIGAACGAIMIVGSLRMKSENSSSVRSGAILVLVFTIIGAIFTFGGYVIGFILGLVGSILGLRWKPLESTQLSPATSIQSMPVSFSIRYLNASASS